MNPKRKRELLLFVASYLESEQEEESAHDYIASSLSQSNLSQMSDEDLWLRARALMNVRPPEPISDEFKAAQNELLQGIIEEAGISTLADTTQSKVDPRIHLWRGDITTLAVDAIVNAANSKLTGCWAPLHYCIDNAIHTFAGVQLRAECSRLMKEQGHPEPTAHAKVTSAYNLPSNWVIHTVGPIASEHSEAEADKLLAQCYIACLNAAVSVGAMSIAFPCISTGVFGFPQDRAAKIAVKTVFDWLNEKPCCRSLQVVFVVFGETDEKLYRELLRID